MTIKEIPQMYETSDGQEFKNKMMAERHEEMVEVKHEYDTARRAYAKALAATQITADGRPFDLKSYHDYYFVTLGLEILPAVRWVSFSYWNIELDDQDTGFLVQHEERRGGRQRIRYEIGKLYYFEKNAKKACLEAMWERLSQLTADVNDYQSNFEDSYE